MPTPLRTTRNTTVGPTGPRSPLPDWVKGVEPARCWQSYLRWDIWRKWTSTGNPVVHKMILILLCTLHYSRIQRTELWASITCFFFQAIDPKAVILQLFQFSALWNGIPPLHVSVTPLLRLTILFIHSYVKNCELIKYCVSYRVHSIQLARIQVHSICTVYFWKKKLLLTSHLSFPYILNRSMVF